MSRRKGGMNNLKYLIESLNNNRIYVWMLVFIILCNIATFMPHKEKKEVRYYTHQIQERLQQSLDSDEERLKIFAKNPKIFILSGFITTFLLIMFLLGIIFLARFILLK